MKLAHWMKREKLTDQAMGDRIGRSHSVVQRYRNGQRIPGPISMVRIFVESNGEVQPNDFYDLPVLTANVAVSPVANGPAAVADEPTALAV